MSFKTVFADQGVIYTVTDTGDLLFYQDQARNGTANWANGGVGQKIGSGWGSFRQVFSGGDGIIYAITVDGDFCSTVILRATGQQIGRLAQWARR